MGQIENCWNFVAEGLTLSFETWYNLLVSMNSARLYKTHPLSQVNSISLSLYMEENRKIYAYSL